MQISDANINIIKHDLKKRGITSDSLGEDLLDHMCLLVEDELNETNGFKAAYAKALLKFGSFRELQSLTDKEIDSASFSFKFYKYSDYAFTLLYIIIGYFTLILPFTVLIYKPIEIFLLISPMSIFGFIICFTRINYKKFEIIPFKQNIFPKALIQ